MNRQARPGARGPAPRVARDATAVYESTHGGVTSEPGDRGRPTDIQPLAIGADCKRCGVCEARVASVRRRAWDLRAGTRPRRTGKRVARDASLVRETAGEGVPGEAGDPAGAQAVEEFSILAPDR